MGLKAIILVGLLMAILLQITSQVAARDLTETTTSKTKTDAVGDQAHQIADYKHGGYGGYRGGGGGGRGWIPGRGGGGGGGGSWVPVGRGGKVGWPGREWKYCPPKGC